MDILKDIIKMDYNKVIYVDVIKETDWQNLKETVDNRITLITCVEDKPEFRRCVQAVEIKEE